MYVLLMKIVLTLQRRVPAGILCRARISRTYLDLNGAWACIFSRVHGTPRSLHEAKFKDRRESAHYNLMQDSQPIALATLRYVEASRSINE